MKTQIKQYGNKILHRDNTKNIVRKTYKDKYGVAITLTGRYGFEWTVSIKRPSMCLCVYSFNEGRRQALDYFNLVVSSLK